jgi:hypothetical protein
MVVTYLEKIRDGFLDEKVYIERKLTEALIVQKENIEFIKLLEQNNDSNFEAFTPRTVNSLHKKKIEELKIEQDSNSAYIEKLNIELQNVNEKLDEVNAVISVAKNKRT